MYIKQLHRKSLIVMVSILTIITFFSTQASDGIEVVGTAKVSVVPDMATFSFAINERGDNLVELKKSVDSKSIQVVELGKKLGVEITDITSTEVSIRPDYDYKTKKLRGYEVYRDITLILKELSNYSAIVNGAIESGINTIRNVNLDTQNRGELENKMLGAAVEAAKIKATIIAKNSGVNLGKVINVKESGNSFQMEVYKSRGMAEASMKQSSFEPGEISVTANVLVKYAIN